MSGPAGFAHLPDELLLQIFNCIDALNIGSALRVCRDWFRVGRGTVINRDRILSAIQRNLSSLVDRMNTEAANPVAQLAEFAYILARPHSAADRNTLCRAYEAVLRAQRQCARHFADLQLRTLVERPMILI